MQLINGIDNLGQAFNKENNNTKESFVNLSLDNTLLTITKFNGTTISVALPVATGNQVISPVGSITIGSTSGSYNRLTISPIDYIFNAQKYSILTNTVLSLSANASGYDRLDAVYIDTTSNTIGAITGTPASTPLLPTLASNQILVGAVYVKAGASSTTFNSYSLVYSAFQSQNITNQINQGSPIKYLNDLLDVLASSAGNNQVLTWDSTLLKWIPTNKDVTPTYDSTAGNGLTVLADGTVVLGGDLFQNTEINLNGNEFIITNGTTSLIDFGNYQLIYNDTIKIDWANGRLYDINGNLSLLFNNRQLLDTTSQVSLDWDDRLMYDSFGNIMIDYQNRWLKASNNKVRVDWEAASLKGQNEFESLNFYGRTLTDYNQNLAQDWEGRYLYSTSGVAVADYRNGHLKVYQTPVEGNDVVNKDYVDSVSSSLTGTNGVYTRNGFVGLGGNYEHLSDKIRSPYDYTYTQTTSTLNDYQQILNFKNYSSSGDETINSNYFHYNDSLYYSLKNSSIVYGLGNSGITFDSPNNQIYFQNNNFFFNTQNSGGTEKVRVSASQYSGFNSDITYNSDSSQLRSASNYFSYSCSNSSSPDSINFGLNNYGFNFNSTNSSGNQTTLNAQSNFYYQYYDGSITTSLNVSSSNITYSTSDGQNRLELSNSYFQLTSGGFDIFNQRNLKGSAGEQVMEWTNGYIKQNYTPISGDYTVLPTDYFLELTFTNPITITLPVATTSAGQELIFKHNDRPTGTTIIQASTGELIDDGASVVLASPNASLRLICNATKWMIISI